MGITEAPCRFVAVYTTSASLSACHVLGSHSPSLCPSSTVVPTHHIFAGKSLLVASIPTRCVKFRTGQSTRAWQCCVPCWGLSLCFGFGAHASCLKGQGSGAAHVPQGQRAAAKYPWQLSFSGWFCDLLLGVSNVKI